MISHAVHTELLGARVADCGCPEEDWLMGMAEVTIHLETNGTGDAFFDFGDWQEDRVFKANSMADLRCAATSWLSRLPPEGVRDID